MENILSKALREFMNGPLNQLLVNMGGKNGERVESELNKFNRQEPCWVPHGYRESLVRVDRTIRPVYPEWMKDLSFPELEIFGPSEFDIRTLER